MRTLLPCALLAFGTSLAQAQALSDPTRPPQVAPGALREATSEAAPAALRLQSVLISPARKLAVIDGRTVTVGARVDDATVVQIAETHVTLRQGGELKTLELYPGIERKPVKTEKKGSSQ